MDLYAYFGKFGELADCYVPPGNKGIAFISFADPNSASAVLESQTHEVKDGCTIVVARAFGRPGSGGNKGISKGCPTAITPMSSLVGMPMLGVPGIANPAFGLTGCAPGMALGGCMGFGGMPVIS